MTSHALRKQCVGFFIERGDNMKEKWKEWTASLTDPQIMSKKDFLLTETE